MVLVTHVQNNMLTEDRFDDIANHSVLNCTAMIAQLLLNDVATLAHKISMNKVAIYTHAII